MSFDYVLMAWSGNLGVEVLTTVASENLHDVTQIMCGCTLVVHRQISVHRFKPAVSSTHTQGEIMAHGLGLHVAMYEICQSVCADTAATLTRYVLLHTVRLQLGHTSGDVTD